MLIIITTVFSRTIVKYKERGWRYIFFEAGHLTQNIYLISTLLKLNCCAIGGFLDERLIKLLDLNPISELPLYLIAIG
jgi:SagB-type dehydrogenase family enzyme